MSSFNCLVISGGSIKGLGILGALQYAKDNYYLDNITTYIGVSVGAIIGYLLAIGYSPIEILLYIFSSKILDKMKYFNIIAMLNGEGASSFIHIQEHLERMTIEKIGSLITLKDLMEKYKKKLVACSYNSTDRCVEYISYENYPSMPCLTALRMSANLPLIFEEFKYLGKFYIDGGVADHFPIQIGDIEGNTVLGIIIKGRKETNEKGSEVSLLEKIYSLLSIPIEQNIEYKIEKVSNRCKIFSIFVDSVRAFDFDIKSRDRLEMFSSGYQQAKVYFDKI